MDIQQPKTELSSSLLIQGGRILDPQSGWDGPGEILIENGKICALEKPGTIPRSRAQEVEDASGCWILPGLIDMHVHLREPGLEYKETIRTGCEAAVAGGFTTVACMANTQPVNDNALVTAWIRSQAKEVDLCRVFPIGAVTEGLQGKKLAQIGGMVKAGVRAISDDGMPIMNSLLMRRAMEYSKAFGIPVISHAEDAQLTQGGIIHEGPLSEELGLAGNPAAAEEIMVAREIALCRLTGARVHIAHVSTFLAVELIRRAKEEGLPLTAEVSPHHLTLTDQAVHTYDTHCKMAPPLRSLRDVNALRSALAEGVIDVIATDHAPHGAIDKKCEFDQAANGIIGLQTALALTLQLVHDGLLSPLKWVRSLTLGPAEILGLPLGRLQTGTEADITVLCPDEQWAFSARENRSKSANSPFMDWKLKGRVKATLVSGKSVYARS